MDEAGAGDCHVMTKRVHVTSLDTSEGMTTPNFHVIIHYHLIDLDIPSS